MEGDYRKGKKSKLRISSRRRKGNNILKFNQARYADLPCLTKSLLLSVPDKFNEGNQPDVLSVESMNSEAHQSLLFSEAPCCSKSDSDVMGIDNEATNQLQELPRKRKVEVSIDGSRIVYLQHFIDSLKTISNHSPLFGCSLANMRIVKELKKGFETKLTFECEMCSFTKTISTCPEQPNRVDVNTSAVTAVMNAGGGYTQLKNITGAMDIPSLSFTLYKKVHSEICNAWEELAWESMKEAAEEERKIALDCNSVDINGTPMITVVCDGSWAKRSYRGGGNYNSLSGVAAIVGLKTGKILYLGVKNKYCCICQRANNKGEQAAEHSCYKNWSSSSTAMEASIIAEGFCSSLEMYNIIYNKMIADGDSSCYKKILDSRPYETCVVQKVECTNHLLRNYSSKLRELSKAKGIPGALRNVIANNVLRCRTAVTKAVQYRKNEVSMSEEEKIRNLRTDIINSVSHIFGEHEKCSRLKYFCEKIKADENNYMSDFRAFGIEEKLMDSVRYLASHSKSLLENVNTNIVEQFNATIAQKVGGKRINYTLRRCYQGRCFSAVVSKNTKRPLYKIYKHLSGGKSPGKNVIKIEQAKICRQKKKLQSRKKLMFSTSKMKEPDSDYGENCQKPDLEQRIFNELKTEFLCKLDKSESEYRDLEMRTRLQADSTEWKQYRRKILTSSLFGKICKMRPKTSCSSSVTEILYKEFFSKATAWGKNNEDRAKRSLEAKFGFIISDCGLFINKNWPFLGASPDGIVEGTGQLVEIKCPFSARNLTIKEAISNKIINYLEIRGEQYYLKKTHNYYYQVQGQLNISHKQICLFSVWSLKDIVCIEIPVDNIFFESSMLPKLEKFYFECLLPEIIDPRHTRGMKIRDPKSRIDEGK